MGEVLPPFTVNAAAFDCPPPGPELTTVISSHPVEAMSDAVIEAVNCVEFTNVVGRELPLKFTAAPFTKAVPFTVRANPALPAIMLDCRSDEIVGTGLVTVKFTAADVPPGAGFVTVTGNIPAVAMSVVVIMAVS